MYLLYWKLTLLSWQIFDNYILENVMFGDAFFFVVYMIHIKILCYEFPMLHKTQ